MGILRQTDRQTETEQYMETKQEGERNQSVSHPQSAGGRPQALPAGITGKVKPAQKAFDQPGRDTGRLCLCWLQSRISMAPEPRAWGGRDGFSLGAGAGSSCSSEGSTPVSLPIHHAWHTCGPSGPLVLARAGYSSHSLLSAAHGCFPAFHSASCP